MGNEMAKKMPSAEAIQLAAQVWCAPNCSHIEMDVVLATEFARVIDGLKAEINALEAWQQVAADSNISVDAYLRSVFPGLKKHYGMPVDGVRKTIEHVRSLATPAAPPHTTPPTQDCTSPTDTPSTPPSTAGGDTPAPTSGGSAPLDGD